MENDSIVQKFKQFILKNKVLFTIIVCLIACTAVMSGITASSIANSNIVSAQLSKSQVILQEQSEKYDALQTDYDSLLSDYNQIQEQCDEIKSEIEIYKEQQNTIDELNSEIDELKQNYSALSDTNSELTAKNASLEEENAALQSEVSSLQASRSQTSTYSSDSAPSYDAPADNNSSVGTMVWLSATGSKYHSIPDCGNMNPANARQVTRSAAESAGYEACKKCW